MNKFKPGDLVKTKVEITVLNKPSYGAFGLAPCVQLPEGSIALILEISDYYEELTESNQKLVWYKSLVLADERKISLNHSWLVKISGY